MHFIYLESIVFDCLVSIRLHFIIITYINKNLFKYETIVFFFNMTYLSFKLIIVINSKFKILVVEGVAKRTFATLTNAGSKPWPQAAFFFGQVTVN